MSTSLPSPSPSPSPNAPPDPPPGFAPDPLTPAQVRARRARWAQIVADGKRLHHLVLGSPPQSAATHAAVIQGRRGPATLRGVHAGTAVPAQCRFTETDILRVPVNVSAAARAALWRGHHEARQFPQALEEHFALHPHVARITVRLEGERGSGTDTDTGTGTPPPDPRAVPSGAILVTIHHRGGPAEPHSPHTHRIPLHTFHTLHTQTRVPILRAAALARDLLTRYTAVHPAHTPAPEPDPEPTPTAQEE